MVNTYCSNSPCSGESYHKFPFPTVQGPQTAIATGYPLSLGRGPQQVFWEYLLLEVHWWGSRSPVFQKQRRRRESTWVDSFCPVALPSSPCGVPAKLRSSLNLVQRNNRRVRVLKEEKKKKALRLCSKTGQIFVLEFKLELWGWIRHPEVIQTAEPEVGPGLWGQVRVRWMCFLRFLLISAPLRVRATRRSDPSGKLDRETESERQESKCKVSGNEILLFRWKQERFSERGKRNSVVFWAKLAFSPPLW